MDQTQHQRPVPASASAPAPASRAYQFHPARAAIVDLFDLYLGRSSRQKPEDSSREPPDLFDQVTAECSQHHLELQSLIRKIQEEGLDVQTTRNAEHCGALIHHLSLVRNKRCLVACVIFLACHVCRAYYWYNRAEIIRSLIWKVGPVLPQEIQEKLSHAEEEYFKKQSAALQSYMSRLDFDLTVDMVPPKDPYIQVRVLEDIGVVFNDDKTTNFACHSIHFLKRTDAEQFISRGLMEELTG